MGRFAKGIAALGLAGALVGGGYQLGKRASDAGTLEDLAGKPVAAGFLDVPGAYTFELRLSGAGEREVYLKGKDGMEMKIADATPRLLSAYEQNPRLVDKAMGTLEKSNRVYRFFTGAD